MKKNHKLLVKELERLLQLKEETIKELQKQIGILRTQPVQPITQPLYPLQPIQTPVQPWQPWGQPYIITSGQTNTLINDPNVSYTLTNSDGTSVTYTLDNMPKSHC